MGHRDGEILTPTGWRIRGLDSAAVEDAGPFALDPEDLLHAAAFQ